MIDLFSLALTHGLMIIAAWRLVQREDLDLPGRLRSRKAPRAAKGEDDHA
ncbi:MAG: hypothetical protein WCY92_09085 [Novosphingobium sp.]|nr:hypothetical protein [Tsuneonella sp. CC-YZS046]WRO66307.1 hypothetical protein U8326_14910 [Tsuneonella sp. CC-YZS046]